MSLSHCHICDSPQAQNCLTFIVCLRILKINCSQWTGWVIFGLYIFWCMCAFHRCHDENVKWTCPCDIWLHKVFELLVLPHVTVKMKSFQSIMPAAVNAMALWGSHGASQMLTCSPCYLIHACTHTVTHIKPWNLQLSCSGWSRIICKNHAGLSVCHVMHGANDLVVWKTVTKLQNIAHTHVRVNTLECRVLPLFFSLG